MNYIKNNLKPNLERRIIIRFYLWYFGICYAILRVVWPPQSPDSLRHTVIQEFCNLLENSKCIFWHASIDDVRANIKHPSRKWGRGYIFRRNVGNHLPRTSVVNVRSWHLYSCKDPFHPLNRRLGGHHVAGVGFLGKRKKIAIAGSEPRSSSP